MQLNFAKYNFFPKVAQFFKEVRQELKKVTWPSRKETTNHTLIIIGASLAVALFLGGLDLLFVFLLNKLIGY